MGIAVCSPTQNFERKQGFVKAVGRAHSLRYVKRINLTDVSLHSLNSHLGNAAYASMANIVAEHAKWDTIMLKCTSGVIDFEKVWRDQQTQEVGQ
jgi:hypothetical protein